MEQPPGTLAAFYWYFLRPVWWVYALIMLCGLFGALIEVSLFAFVGKMTRYRQSAGKTLPGSSRSTGPR